VVAGSGEVPIAVRASRTRWTALPLAIGSRFLVSAATGFTAKELAVPRMR